MQKVFQLLAKLNLVLILDLIGNISLTSSTLVLQFYEKDCELDQIINPLLQYGFVTGIGTAEGTVRVGKSHQDDRGNEYLVYKAEIDGIELMLIFVRKRK